METCNKQVCGEFLLIFMTVDRHYATDVWELLFTFAPPQCTAMTIQGDSTAGTLNKGASDVLLRYS